MHYWLYTATVVSRMWLIVNCICLCRLWHAHMPQRQPRALVTDGALLAASMHTNSRRRASAGRTGSAGVNTRRCMDFPECFGNAQGSSADGLKKQVPSLLYAVMVHCIRVIFVTKSTVNISVSCSLNSWGVWGWPLVIVCNLESSWKFLVGLST